MIDPVKTDWGDMFSSFIAGVITAVGSLFGWFSRKLSGVHKRISLMEDKVNVYAVHIGEQRQQHMANQQRLDTIEEGLRDIDAKQDKQMGILLEMSKRRR